MRILIILQSLIYMTKQRNDSHSTEFGIWLREQPEIDSKLGFLATNIDYMWRNYKTNKWMLIEEKRYNSVPSFWQRSMFAILHRLCNMDKNFKGFHLIVFEKTSPEDGKIYLDKREITRNELLQFLRFEL